MFLATRSKGHNEALTGSSIALSHQGMGAMLVLVGSYIMDRAFALAPRMGSRFSSRF